MPPEAIGRFRLVRLLGEGGMGSVYLGERTDDFRQIAAVKLLREFRDPGSRVRFRAERQVLASLQHPNIVQLIDAGLSADGVPYLIMDYIDGEPLDRYCGRLRMPPRDRIRLMIRVLEALEYAHQHFVVHCDVKFSNILVTPDGQPHLLDFGLTKLLAPSRLGIDSRLTGLALRPFTLAFASPEQLQNKALTTATDVYSCAVVLYQLLTGTHPFEPLLDRPLELVQACASAVPEAPGHRVRRLMHSDRAAVERVAEAMGTTPERLARELRSDLDAVLLKALRKEPERRHAGAARLAGDLESFLNGRPVESRRGSRRYRVWKFVARNHAGVIAALVLLGALLAGGAGVVWQSVRAARSRTAAQARFDDARRLTNSLLVDFYEAVQKLDGSEGARQSLVGWSGDTLESLARQAGTAPDVKLDLARAYLRLGDLQRGGGEWADAVSTCDRGLRLLGTLPSRGRDALPVEARLHETRGRAEEALGRADDAARDLSLAREILARAR